MWNNVEIHYFKSIWLLLARPEAFEHYSVSFLSDASEVHPNLLAKSSFHKTYWQPQLRLHINYIPKNTLKFFAFWCFILFSASSIISLRQISEKSHQECNTFGHGFHMLFNHRKQFYYWYQVSQEHCRSFSKVWKMTKIFEPKRYSRRNVLCFCPKFWIPPYSTYFEISGYHSCQKYCSSFLLICSKEWHNAAFFAIGFSPPHEIDPPQA